MGKNRNRRGGRGDGKVRFWEELEVELGMMMGILCFGETMRFWTRFHPAVLFGWVLRWVWVGKGV